MPAPPLNERQKRHLRRLGHTLHPVVLLGHSGLTDGVVAELELALKAHELVKARARAGDRASRDTAFDALAARTASALVQRIGNVALFFRANAPLSRIVLPD